MTILIQVLAGDENQRQTLLNLVQELGYEGSPAGGVSVAVSTLGLVNPRAVLMAEGGPEAPAETALREVRRAAPFLPVVVCLGKRDASRAIEYMRLGAFDCVSPPWTQESVGACLRKAVRFDGTGLDLAPVPSLRKWAIALGIVFSLLSSFFLGVAVWRYRQSRLAASEASPIRTEWSLPYAHPSGIAWDGRDFWIGDWYGQSLYVHQGVSASRQGLEVRRVYHFPSAMPVAVAFVERTLWTVTASGAIRKHLMDDQLKVLSEYRVPGVVALCYDGLYLWSLDAVHMELSKHLLDDRLTTLQSLPYPGRKPVALACDGKALWSLDGAGPEILKHDLSRPWIVVARQGLAAYHSGRWKPSGLAWDGKEFWTVAEPAGTDAGAQGRLFRHPVEMKAAR